MRGVLLTILTFALSSSVARAAQIEYEQRNTAASSCASLRDTFDVGRALHNSTLYKQVFEWMHERDVDNWNYSTEVQRNGSSEMQCAVVSYNTYIESPTFFARLLRNFHMSLEFPIVVHKQVCVSGHTVVEASTVAVPLINEFSMTARYEVDADEINSTVTAHYQVPWYIEFLVHDIGHHLRHNFKRKLDGVARSLCARTADTACFLL